MSKRLVHTSQDVLLFFENFYLESLVLGLEEYFIKFYISFEHQSVVEMVRDIAHVSIAQWGDRGGDGLILSIFIADHVYFNTKIFLDLIDRDGTYHILAQVLVGDNFSDDVFEWFHDYFVSIQSSFAK